MNPNLIFLPVLVHMLLIFSLYIRLAAVKRRSVGEVDPKVTALDPKAWPEEVVKISNNIANQFETPILFYVLSVILFLTDNVSAFSVSLMGLYVVSRIVHSFIHTGSNYVPVRMKVFLVGTLMLLGTCVWLLIDLLAQ
ncbi:MAG: MAPEG family protein [Pseudomonadota bacterium]|nr:MAPEG family protein [Pseudomonadota bacterium]